jgi:hypothetical protein
MPQNQPSPFLSSREGWLAEFAVKFLKIAVMNSVKEGHSESFKYFKCMGFVKFEDLKMI